MKKEAKNYSPGEFIEKLKSDDFRSQSLIYTGMLKTAEDDKHLLFANGTYCTNWTAIPIDIIENIELVDVIPCKDHTHPLVHITIKEPTSEEAKMFASLARSHPTTGWRPTSMGDKRPDFQRFLRDPRFARNKKFRSSGPDEWFPCWSRCMDDLLEFASEQPPEQWEFWSSLAYQLCDQVCP